MSLNIFKACLPLVCACAANMAWTQDSPSGVASEAEVIIKPRMAAVASASPSTTGRQWLADGIPASQFNKEIVALANLLSNEKLAEEDKQAASEGISRQSAKAGEAFGSLLDYSRHPGNTRMGALRGIQMSNAPAKTVGKALGKSALAEPDAKVRAEAISLIKERKDGMALHTVMNALAAASDTDGLGIINEAQRNAAAQALRDIGSKRVFEILLYYVTLEIRTGFATPVATETKYLTNSGDVSNGGGTINLPIELPTLEIGSFQGMITVPAISDPLGALRRATGQNFGKNLGQWKKWIDEQPAFGK
jgi:hypothetical protein